MPSTQTIKSQPTGSQLEWLENVLTTKFKLSDWELQAPIADASFRAYSRIVHSQGSYMLMHFPPTQEDGQTIVESSKFLIKNNIRVPQLLGYDLDVGVVLQEDMGSELLFSYTEESTKPEQRLELYLQSIGQIDLLQDLDAKEFGYFDPARQIREMQLFSEWFIGKWLGTSEPNTLAELEDLYLQLSEEIFTAPQCCIHLDFHSRNLCVLTEGNERNSHKNIGVLDYQDLLQGHFCYDIWSLLKDAYVLLPEGMNQTLFQSFINLSTNRFDLSEDYVRLHYNLIGVQRCLKVCGTFSRLSLRDGKGHYLPHIPLVLNYLLEATTWLKQDRLSQNTSILSSNPSLEASLQVLVRILPQLITQTQQKLLVTDL